MKLKNQELIKSWEGLRLKAYKPTPNDVWTIGWGHTKGVVPGMVISMDQAQAFFLNDIEWAEDAVNQLVKVPISQNQYDALVSFVFNVGTTNFKKSTLLRKLNNGDYEGAAAEFPRWNKQKGKILRGLVRRRAQEMKVFLTAVSTTKPVTKKDEIEGPKPLKPLFASKELIGGILASLSGVKAFLGPDIPENLYTPLTVLSVAVGVFGLILIINRLKARKNGDR